MAVSGTRRRETFNHILAKDPARTEEDGATVWKLGSITVGQRTGIQDGTMIVGSDRTFRMAIATRNLNIVRLGLRGVSNYKDENGQDVAFKTEKKVVDGEELDVASDEFLDTLEPEWITELAEVILAGNSVSDAERKK